MTTLGHNTWPVVHNLVDNIYTVTEEDILRAAKMVWECPKVCIEPSVGVGVAVAVGPDFSQRYSHASDNVAVVLCGGNVNILMMAKWMEDVGIQQSMYHCCFVMS